MAILEQILDSIKEDYPIQEVRRGLRCTAVVSRECGLASTMLKDCRGEEEDFIGKLIGMDAKEAAGLSLSDKISEASVGMAIINSLIGTCNMVSVEKNASEIIKEAGKGKNISVIGHFPFTDEIRNVAKNLWIIEKWQRLGDLPAGDALRYLPLSDVVAISGTTLINHTIDSLISLCCKDSIKIILGTSTPFSSVLFDCGFDYISGSAVTDKERLFQLISEGASFRQLKNAGCIRLITASRKGK